MKTFNLPDGVSFCGMSLDDMKSTFKMAGFPAFRGAQLYDWVFGKGVVVPSAMTNLPPAVIELLGGGQTLLHASAGQVLTSVDGTRKIEVVLNDGEVVETVLIPDGDKLTQCISSQVGCSVGCTFCRSGKFGFKRNMTAGEIVSQIFVARAFYAETESLTNVVFMGVGEPLHNYDAVLQAYRLICDPGGMALSYRRVTISTAGVVKKIDALGRDTEGRAGLAISLHAANEAMRQQLVPNLKTSLVDLLACLRRYPLPKRRRITIEYVLIDGVNDSDRDARQLVVALNGVRAKVNLLPMNPHDLSDYKPPSEADVERFAQILIDKGVSVFKRKRRGADINAACGQLLGKKPQ